MVNTKSNHKQAIKQQDPYMWCEGKRVHIKLKFSIKWKREAHG